MNTVAGLGSHGGRMRRVKIASMGLDRLVGPDQGREMIPPVVGTGTPVVAG
jgi:hypothetical protein